MNWIKKVLHIGEKIKKVIGKNTEDVIKNSLEEIIISINWPKSMRWIHNSFKWGRPF